MLDVIFLAGGLAFFAYSANYLIDLDHAIIVDVEATTAIRQAEVTAAKRMIDRTMDRFDLYPARLAGDSGYGSAEMLNWLVHDKGIEPHVSVFDKSARVDGTFSRAEFTYDHDGDVYFCPGNKMLTCKGTLVNDGATLLYRASKYDCNGCALKPRCCPSSAARKVPLDPRRCARHGSRHRQIRRAPQITRGADDVGHCDDMIRLERVAQAERESQAECRGPDFRYQHEGSGYHCYLRQGASPLCHRLSKRRTSPQVSMHCQKSS